MTDIVSTGIRIDSTDAVKAKQDLDNLASTGDKVDSALSKIDQAGARTGKTLATLSQNTRKVAETNAQMVAQMQQLNTAQGRQEALLKSIGSSFAGLTAAIKGATTATQAQAKAATDAERATKAEAQAAKQAAQAARDQQRETDRAAAAKASAAAAAERYIQKLREEVQLHGASRAAVEAHRTAQMGLTVEQQRTAELLGAQLDGLNRTKSGLGGIQVAAAGVGSAMAAAFVARRVYDFADSLFQASVNAQRIKTTLQFATGNSEAEFAYLTRLTNKLGLEFNSTASAYAKFAAAARGTTLEGDGARKVFESVSKAAAVMGLSSEEASGALLALQQMMSKGTVQSEELRGQLGERIPGAFRTAARAMGVTEAALGKMLEQGQIAASDFLPKFAAALTESLGDAPEKAALRLEASAIKVGNSWEALKRTVGDAGVSDFMAGQYRILTDAMDSVSEAMNRAKSNGGGFVSQIFAGYVEVQRFLNPLNGLSYSAQSAGEKLKEAEARMVAMQERAKQGIDVHVQMDRLQQLIEALREAKAAADGIGGTGGAQFWGGEASRAAFAKRRTQFTSDLGTYLSDSSRQTSAEIIKKEVDAAKARNKVLEDEAKAVGDTNAVLKLQQALETEISKIKDKNTKKGGAGIERQTDRTQLQADLDRIQREQQGTVDKNANAQRLLEAQRSAGLVDEQAYYAKRQELLQADARAQDQAVLDQIARLQKESFTGKTATKDQIENQNKIDELRGKLTKQQEASATNEQILGIQAASAIRQQEAALIAAREAAQDYFDTTQRGYDRQLAGIGKGNENRQFDAGISQIEERYAQQRQSIRSQRLQAEALAGKPLSLEVQKQYDDQIALQNKFEAKSIESYKDYYTKQKQAQTDWLNGATEGLQNYIDSVNNSAKRAETLVTDGFEGFSKSAAEALFGDRGASFKDLGENLAKQVIEGFISQNFVKPAAEWLQKALSPSGFSASDQKGLDDLIKRVTGGDALASASTSALASSAATATAALTALATASTTAAAAMVGGNISSALSAANSVGISGGDALGALIGLMGWSGGGYTGDGGKYEPAGVVHRGEFVVNKAATDAIGSAGRQYLDRLNRRGYADGGYVGNVLAGNLGARAQPAINFAPVTNIAVDSRSDRAAVIADVQRVVTDSQKAYTQELQRAGVIRQ